MENCWKTPTENSFVLNMVFLPVEKLVTRDSATLRQREMDLINNTGVLSTGLNHYR